MDIYKETAEKLRKLGLNETKMDKEQFVRYASTLKKYRMEIIAGVNKILKAFWLAGLLVEEDGDADALCRKVQGILDDEAEKGEMKRLKDILFQTYSLEKLLDAACLVHDRILYEAYAPYWISKCTLKPLPDGIRWAGIHDGGTLWYNGMIGMYWHDGYKVWVSDHEIAWRMSLPPTKELCESECRKGKCDADA